MSEFKGTKGEWKHILGSWYVDHIESNGNIVADIRNVSNNLDEINANAKLISCAPELLQALQWFCERVDKGEVRSTKTYNKFKQLIEKATTI